MPFKSQAQRRFFYAAANRGDVPESVVRRWEKETPKGKKLPEHVKTAAAFVVGIKEALLKLPVSSEDHKEFRAKHGKNTGVSLARDKDGFYVKTHRCRSKSYPRPSAIPNDRVKFVGSTG